MSARRLVLGTAGHIDHGKTTLVHALTGVDTDRLAEEKRRGITIDLGFAELPLDDDTALAVVDVPGHEGFVRNMLAGATGIDVMLLVVAADEGVMPQTREHLAIVELLDVAAGVVAVTKADLVEPEWLHLVVDDLAEQLAGGPFGDAQIVPVSARTGAGLDALRAALGDSAQRARQRDAAGLFRLPVDRVFTIRGTGTVVTGTIVSGGVHDGASVRILPGPAARIAAGPTAHGLGAGLVARVRGVQVHGAVAENARAGHRAALALAGVDHADVRRGNVVVSSDAPWRPTSMLSARIRVIPGTEWRVRNRQRLRIHLGTAEVMGRAILFGTRELGPGDEAWAQLRLETPLVARAGDRFVLRSYSPVTTLGGGTVAEPLPPKRKRLDDDARAALDAVLAAAPDAAERLVRLEAWRGLEAESLPLRLISTPRRDEDAPSAAGPDRSRPQPTKEPPPPPGREPPPRPRRRG